MENIFKKDHPTKNPLLENGGTLLEEADKISDEELSPEYIPENENKGEK